MSRSSLPNPADTEVDFAPLGLHKSDTGRSIDIARFALSIWKPLALGAVLGSTMGVLMYLWQGPVYKASTRIQVSKKASLPVNSAEARRYSDRSSHIHIMTSDEIARRAFEDHGLKEIPGIAKAYDPLKEISEGLSVKLLAGQDSSYDILIDVAFEHPDKKVAAKVVESVIGAYEDWLLQSKETNSTALHKNLLKQRGELEKAIRELNDLYLKWRDTQDTVPKSTPVVLVNGMPTVGRSAEEMKIDGIEATIRGVHSERIRTRSILRMLDRMVKSKESADVIQFAIMRALSAGQSGGGGGEGGGSGGGAPGLGLNQTGKQELDQQLLTIKLLETKLLSVLGPNHSDVRNVRRQMDTILSFYRQMGFTPPTQRATAAGVSDADDSASDLASVYRKTMESRLEQLNEEEEMLNTELKEARQDSRKLAQVEIQDQDWKDRISAKKKERDGINSNLTEYEQSRSQEGYTLEEISQIRVERSLMRVLKTIGMFTILGIIGVFGLAYFREWYDTTLKTVDEVREVARAALIGAVPAFTAATLKASTATSGISPALVYFHRPGSREAEAYRAIRTTLFFSTRDTQDRVIQISSPEPGDGKSTSVANLAVAVAQSGKKVLLIDADLRRPTVHSLFGLPQDNGLTDVLLKEVIWPAAVRQSRIDHLFVMTAGLCPESPAELLSTGGLGDLLQEARHEFDYIFVDSPPILAVSDPCIISPHADGMILVVRMEKNKRAVLQHARETIDSHGIRLYGVIANDVNITDTGAGYGYRYASYSEYHNEDAGPVTSPRSGSRYQRTTSPAEAAAPVEIGK